MFGLKTEVSNLLKLQEIDLAIDKNKRLRANLEETKSLDIIESELSDLNKLKTKIKDGYDKENQVLKKDNDELDILNRKIKKEEQKLFSGSIGNPKELAAIQQEVGALNNRRDALETNTLEQMDKVSDLEKKLSIINEKLSQLTTDSDQLKITVEKKQKEIDIVLADLNSKRQDTAKTIDEELLLDYEDTRVRKDGIGVAALVNGICQACHVEVPETELEEIINSDKPDYCPNCGRLLVVISEK